MLGQVITENGQKKVIPLTADAGAGNPVGTVIVVCSNQIPSNYLPLGTQYDTSLYPILYALLGTDTTPTASALGLPTLISGQYAIKATSGLSENAQDNVVAQLNEERSYSTEEHPTGKKWIDGKPIYSKVVEINSATARASSQSFPHGVTGLEKIITLYGNCVISNRERMFPYFDNENKCFVVYYDSTNIVIFFGYSTTNLKLVIEYTKTTD